MVAHARRLVREVARVLDRDRHVGALERDRLVAADRAAERLALARVRDRRVEASLREPDRERGDRDAALVENAQEGLEALAARAEQVVLGNAATVEDELVRVGRVPAHLAVRRPSR